jgi:hypothetical protein
MSQRVIEEIAYDDAADLMADLRMSNHEVWGEVPRDWIFRGLSNADFGLIPSAFRSRLPTGTDTPEWPQGPRPSEAEQCRSEWLLLRRFILLADAQGLPIPGDTPRVWEALSADGAPLPWPPLALRPSLALAQHYGVPTRLLDWTRVPLIAAWFAADEAARRVVDGQQAGESRLCVWALRRRVDGHLLLDHHGVRSFSAPRSDNLNLHLQSGLFTCAPVERPALDRPPDVRPLDAVVEQLAGADRPLAATERPLLRKMTLPAAQAPFLLRLLADHLVFGSSVYGGYEGVSRGVMESRYRESLT